jgi:sugar/nucleoside kinase (ribokinase family)
VRVLLGDAISVFPIGGLGNDRAGSILRSEMEQAGLDLRFVLSLNGVPTLFSFCLAYPDGSGGNLTTEDSASSRLGPDDIADATDIIRSLGKEGIALAVPEVPLSARVALLDLATVHGLFRAANFTRAEMEEVQQRGILDRVDLLAVNAEEALAIAGMPDRGSNETVIEHAIDRISQTHPHLTLSVTAGRAGRWTWDTQRLRQDLPLHVEARATAGAGDAHLAGTLSGLAAGIEFADAQNLGTCRRFRHIV